MGKLTKRLVDSTQRGERDRFVWDEAVKGFGLKVTPKGSRIYVFQYRMGGRGSATRRYTIGKHGSPWTVETARDEARKLLGEVKSGRDPMKAKIETRRAAASGVVRVMTVAEALVKFGINHVSKRRSAYEIMRTLKHDVLRAWGDRPLEEITRRDVIELLDAIEARGAPYLRNRMRAHLSTFFRWCIGKDIIADNPTMGVSRLREEARDRVLSEDEIRRVWAACGEIGEPYGSLVRMLLLTGQRRDEVGGMTWDEIDSNKVLWTIPKQRAKNALAHDVPLSGAVQGLLAAMPNLGRFVFTVRGDKPFNGFDDAKQRLDKRSRVIGWRLHDLRRTAATEMARLGIAQHVVEKLLNHRSGSIRGVAAVYNRHSYLDERRSALEAWARRLETIVDRSASNVVELTYRA